MFARKGQFIPVFVFGGGGGVVRDTYTSHPSQRCLALGNESGEMYDD